MELAGPPCREVLESILLQAYIKPVTRDGDVHTDVHPLHNCFNSTHCNLKFIAYLACETYINVSPTGYSMHAKLAICGAF